MRVTSPVDILLPATGVRFAESAHATGFRMAERADPFHKILYVLAGCAQLRLAGRAAVTGAAGTALLVPAGKMHGLDDVEPATILLLCFSRRWLATVPELTRLWPAAVTRSGGGLALAGSMRLRLEASWRRALFEQGAGRQGGAAIVFASAADIVAQLARAETLLPGLAPAERIRALLAAVAGSFVEPWTLEEAARRAGMSRRSFTAYFRTQCGETFWEHLEGLRIAHATRLLREGEHTIIGVMFSSGFNDLSTFYRAFKRRRGASPKRWASM